MLLSIFLEGLTALVSVRRMQVPFIDLTPDLRDREGQDCHQIIQAALQGGNRVVRLPPGSFILGKTLKIGSHTKIIADKNTVLSLAPGFAKRQEDWLVTNDNSELGNEDIEIEGGVWDGNCAHNPRGEEYAPGAFGGVAINFIKVNGLRLTQMTVANADCFFIRLGEVEGFHIEAVNLFNHRPRINQDGVHVGGYCRNGVIAGLHAISPMTPGDDMVALNADDDVERHMNKGMRLGPIENVEIRDLTAESAYTFVRLLSQDHLIRNIDIANLRGGVRNNGLNMNRWRFPVGGGNIRDVKIRDVRLHKMPCTVESAKIQPEPIFDLDLRVRNLEIKRFERPPLDQGVGDSLRLRAPDDCSIDFCGNERNPSLVRDGEFLRLPGGGFGSLRIA